MKWPCNKDFAFTIIDDTDNSTITNTKPVYDLLYSNGLRTTKTVWVYPPRDSFKGSALTSDAKYLDYVKELAEKGFEIQLHNVGSGFFSRAEILEGLDVFEKMLETKPTIQINHNINPDNIYWGQKRHVFPLNLIISMLKPYPYLGGHTPSSEHFWGDWVKRHIKYSRNHTFLGINTLKFDPKMPYRVKHKANGPMYWFSSSDAYAVENFNQLLSKRNIEKLKKENGCCIIYTHFASRFVGKDGMLNNEFKKRIEYLSNQNGYFATASEILDHLLKQKKASNHYASWFYLAQLDLKWIVNKIRKKILFPEQ